MNIFRGKKPRHGRRAEQSRRQRSRRRHSAPDHPLSELVVEEKAALASGGTRRKTKREGRHETPQRPITLVHVAFLLVGLALGAGLLMSVNALLKWHHAAVAQGQVAAEAAKQPAVAPTEIPPPALPPAKQVYQATSPTEAVRVMLKASFAGDKDTAYGQWEIKPGDVATIRAGQALTLAETTATAGEAGGSVSLDDYEFALTSQSGDQASVAQTRGGAVVQIYSVRRRGSVWKIRFASRP
ncbi:hypothetical protein LLH23_17050 [bacterium]|nr:hypothetical protein [bacterium]